MDHLSLVKTLGITFLAAYSIAEPTSAQDQAANSSPTPEEYAEKAEKAENAPLFASNDPIVMTLRTDIQFLRDERPEEEEIPGTLTFVDLDGSVATTEIEVRTRGDFRRSKRNCNFPPLRLDFKKDEMKGTVFEGQDKLKLVTPCHDSRDAYQSYVYQEYLVYKTFNLITPASFRVRLVEITYEDIEDDYDTRTKVGFLIEDEEAMAERNYGLFYESGPDTEIPRLNPGRTDSRYSTTMALFQFLIGNTDWSSVEFHNVKLVETQDGKLLTIPYDFDFSGAVDARYATPFPQLPIRDVRDRLFRGFCFPDVQRRDEFAELFNEKRAEIWALYEGFGLLEPKDAKRTLDWYKGFFEVVNSERRWDRQIVRSCRG